MAIVCALSSAQALAEVCDGDVFAFLVRDMQEASDVKTGDGRKSAKNALDGMRRFVETVKEGRSGRGPFDEVLKNALIKGKGFGLYGARHLEVGRSVEDAAVNEIAGGGE